MTRVNNLKTDYSNGDIYYADDTLDANVSGTNIENTETNQNTLVIEETFNGVVSGCEVRQNSGGANMSVDVQSGVIVVDGERVTVSAQDVTIDAADGSNPRIDLIMVGQNGTADYVKGTAAATPLSPAWTADHVLIATVYVAAGDTSITDSEIFQTRELYTGNKSKRFEILVDSTNQPTTTGASPGTLGLFGFPAGTFKNWFRISTQGRCDSSSEPGDNSSLIARFSDQNRANNIDLGVTKCANGSTDFDGSIFICDWWEDQSDNSDDFLSIIYNQWDSVTTTFQRTSSTNYDLTNQIFHLEMFGFNSGGTNHVITLNKFTIEGY